jgi:ribosomal protein L31E
MLNKKQLQELKPKLDKLNREREEARYTYLGMLSEYQLFIKEPKQTLIYTKLNPTQHFLFKRVLHGLKMYKREEVTNMHWDKKRRITKVWKRGQNIINELKQFVSYKQMQQIFRIFTKSELGKEIYEMPFEYMPDYKNKLTLKELGLSYEDLIIKFMGVGLLPKNYLEINVR